MEITNREIIIWLNSIKVNNRTIANLMKELAQLTELWYMSSGGIYRLKSINNKNAEKIINNRNKDYLKKTLEKLKEKSVRPITIFDDDYPERLHHIYDKPKVIYMKGEMLEEDNMAIAIVGSRKATTYGKWATGKFVEELTNLGVTIVSGLALGIDGVAHKKALEMGGRTLGVLGSGPDIVYPKRNRNIFKQLAENGALISEYFLETPPLPYHFPQRNRIISGLSLGVIVIEAQEKSGSLITANHALEQGKEVFALPGNINSIFSRGTNRLIKDGAKLIMDVEDIIEELYELQAKLEAEKEKDLDYSQFSSLERQVIDCIKDKPIHSDNIAIRIGLDISEINSILTILELKGVIKEMTGRIFTLS